MKKTIMAIAVLFSTFSVASAQEKIHLKTDSTAKVEIVKVVGDTIKVLPNATFIEIGGKIYHYSAFKSFIPIFMSSAEWGEVLNIINTRDYGKTPATVVAQLIQAIGQYLPRQNQ